MFRRIMGFTDIEPHGFGGSCYSVDLWSASLFGAKTSVARRLIAVLRRTGKRRQMG